MRRLASARGATMLARKLSAQTTSTERPMTSPLPSRAERYAKGKSLRKVTPRGAHGKLVGPMDRDANAILEAQNGTRLPALVPLRAQLMASNPFAYLRGAAAVMAHDLQMAADSRRRVQACGDCHLMNFGAFATPEDNILFDINDFDETLPGVDFTVDLKRLAASIAVAAADLRLADGKTPRAGGRRRARLSRGAWTAFPI